jgi:hypothetical protein
MSGMQTTWKPHEKHGQLTERGDLPDSELAFARIKKAAEYYDVGMTETDWHQLGSAPHTGRTAEDRRESAREGVETKRARGEL